MAKTERVNLRVSSRDDVLFRQAALVQRENVSEFLIESGRERAERVLADRSDFRLDAAAWDTFVEALDRPAEVIPAVSDLLKRPRPQ